MYRVVSLFELLLVVEVGKEKGRGGALSFYNFRNLAVRESQRKEEKDTRCDTIEPRQSIYT